MSVSTLAKVTDHNCKTGATFQRALMRVRLKLIDESNERDKVHLQRVRLLEMAHLNEKERLARLEQFKMVCRFSYSLRNNLILS